MDAQQPTDGARLCECGCGGIAPIAQKTRRGYRKGESMRFIRGHHMRVPEIRATAITPERNAKISAAHADGRIPNPQPRSGAAHEAWRGDDIGYAQAHARIAAARGPATNYDCQECGMRADEWAIDHDLADRRELHGGIVKPFSTDVTVYVSLCRSCHRKADRRGGFRVA